MPLPRRMSFANIPAAPARLSMPSATAEVVAVAGRYYLWQQSAPLVGAISYSAPAVYTRCYAWPLVIPFDAVWDQVRLMTHSTDLTDGYRLALYRGDPANGHRPEAGGAGLLAEVVLGPPIVSGVEEAMTRVIAIDEPAGTVVWAFFGVDTNAGAGDNHVVHFTAANLPTYGFGTGFTWDNYGVGLGFKESPVGFRLAGAVYGPVPPDPFSAGWSDRQGNLAIAALAFRCASVG